jgi:L-lactate dehydrogenase complex protein LldE
MIRVRAVLFHTCLIDQFFPAVGFAVVRILERLGFDVDVPADQTCCGQPAFNAGFHDEAQAAARHTVAVLERTTGPIVIPSGSCGDMLIHQYGVLLEPDEAWKSRWEALKSRCCEFSAFVAPHIGRLGVGHVRSRVAYHPSCHLARGLGIDREPRTILDGIGGVELRPLEAEEECCGFGGLFSVKHADISSRMLERKLNHVVASGAERLISCDMGCLLQLGGGLHRRGAGVKVQHLAELLAEALV